MQQSKPTKSGACCKHSNAQASDVTASETVRFIRAQRSAGGSRQAQRRQRRGGVCVARALATHCTSGSSMRGVRRAASNTFKTPPSSSRVTSSVDAATAASFGAVLRSSHSQRCQRACVQRTAGGLERGWHAATREVVLEHGRSKRVNHTLAAKLMLRPLVALALDAAVELHETPPTHARREGAASLTVAMEVEPCRCSRRLRQARGKARRADAQHDSAPRPRRGNARTSAWTAASASSCDRWVLAARCCRATSGYRPRVQAASCCKRPRNTRQ